ncbi:MAG: ATP-binding cassette domain-containing protein, partial [Thaumarchaeota archaeon]|nr:ATP-binding cassette domain-containing protein [Nitrososphaerota archaeon]
MLTEKVQEKEEVERAGERMEGMNQEQVVSISNLDVKFGNLHVLKNLSLQMERKKITVIMGPSGCGKSTFIRTLNRMNDHIAEFRLSGKVLFNGVDIYSKEVDPALLRLKVGMVFQKPNPFPMSIYDNVAFGPKIHKMYSNKQELDAI